MTSLPGMQWDYIGSLDMLEYEVMRSLMSSQRGCSVLGFRGPQLALGVSRRDILEKLNCWSVNQHWARWRGLGDTKDKLENWPRDLVWMPRPKFCPLIGLNPGL